MLVLSSARVKNWWCVAWICTKSLSWTGCYRRVSAPCCFKPGSFEWVEVQCDVVLKKEGIVGLVLYVGVTKGVDWWKKVAASLDVKRQTPQLKAKGLDQCAGCASYKMKKIDWKNNGFQNICVRSFTQKLYVYITNQYTISVQPPPS